MTARSLQDIHTTKTGKVSDKWESYFRVYERVLGPLRDRELSMLEIGVQNGGSLDVWAEYLPHAKVIIGCDIDERCRQLRYADPRIKVVVADVTSQQAYDEILDIQPEFDVVIDDGSHLSAHILHSFLTFFRHVRPGGIFIIEDTHTLFWENWGGGVLKRDGAHEFFKLLADLVNAEHWEKEIQPTALFSTFFSSNNFPEWLLEGWVESVEFTNSMIILRKSLPQSRSRLGKRIVSGTDAAVNAAPLELAKKG